MVHIIGSFYIAPAAAPDDEYAAGYDGNTFPTADAAEAEIHELAAALGGDPTDWVVCRRGGADRTEEDDLSADVSSGRAIARTSSPSTRRTEQ